MVNGGNVKNMSTVSLAEKEKQKEKEYASDSSSIGNKEEKGVMSYWGIERSKITKPDGTEWRWNCFRVCMPLY